MSEYKPTAPQDENLRFISFHQNLYPKIMLPEIDMNNYRINRIMYQYKYLDEERKESVSIIRWESSGVMRINPMGRYSLFSLSNHFRIIGYVSHLNILSLKNCSF